MQDAGFPFSQESLVQESFCSDRQKTVKHFSVFCIWGEVGVTLFARRSARELSHKSAAADIIRLAFVIRFPLEKDCRRKYPFLGEFSCPEIRNFRLGLGNPWADDRWSPAKEKIHQSARGIKGSRCKDTSHCVCAVWCVSERIVLQGSESRTAYLRPVRSCQASFQGIPGGS